MKSPRTPSRRLEVLVCILLVAASLFAYIQVKDHGFVFYDDDHYIVENPFVRNGLSVDGLKWAFTTVHAANWHPLTWLSHMLDCQLFGLDAGWHHLMNLFFHLLNTVLLFWVLRALTGSLWRSAFVATLFALHPLHVQSVAWAAERKDVLSTLFWFLTLGAYLLYARRPGLKRYALVFLFLALGLMAKPMLVTVPVVLMLLDYWPLGRLGEKESNIPRVFRLALEKAPLFALSAASSVATVYAQKAGGAVKGLDVLPFKARAANALVSYVLYLKKMLWPAGLSIFYPMKRAIPLWQPAAAFFLLALVTFLVVRARSRQPYMLTGWLWYLVTLVPVIGIVQVGSQAMADRYTYVPLIGPFIMVAWGVPALASRWRGLRVLLAPSAVVVLAVLMVLTRQQVGYWRDSLTLFGRALKVTEKNSLVLNNYGMALLKKGRLDEAEAVFREVTALTPKFPRAYNNLGVVEHLRGRLGEARGYYRRAIKLDPHYDRAYFNIGLALADEGRFRDAVGYYKKAIERAPGIAKYHKALGVALERLGRLDEAVESYSQALKIDPRFARAHDSLGVALAKKGQIKEALGHFSRAASIEPGYKGAFSNWGNALMVLGRLDEAVSRYRKALDIDPGFAQAHNNLGVALMRQGSLKEALKSFERAINIAPEYSEARQNREFCLNLMKEASSPSVKPEKPPSM